MLPQDPVILLSYVNTWLRDHTGSLDDLFAEHGLSSEEGRAILEKLSSIDYHYDETQRKFV
jgi:hypothetical protein